MSQQSTFSKSSLLEKVGRVLYRAKPADRPGEILCILHAMMLQSGFVCTGAHEDEPEGDKVIVLPQNWAQHKSDGVYGFRYKSEDRKHVLQLKAIHTGGDNIDVNIVYDKLPNQILSGELIVNKIDANDIDTAVTQIAAVLQPNILSKIGFSLKKEEAHVPGFNLQPVILEPRHPGGIFGPRGGIERPDYDIRPNLGQGDLFPGGEPGGLMGPEHPFFGRQNQRFIRQDPPLGFPRGPGGLGGFGGPGPFGGFMG